MSYILLDFFYLFSVARNCDMAHEFRPNLAERPGTESAIASQREQTPSRDLFDVPLANSVSENPSIGSPFSAPDTIALVRTDYFWIPHHLVTEQIVRIFDLSKPRAQRGSERASPSRERLNPRVILAGPEVPPFGDLLHDVMAGVPRTWDPLG